MAERVDVPYAMERPDLAPKQRYYDPGFFALEAEMLWSRVWQMACRLEEIPNPRDFAEYRILDQSIVVVRTDDMGVVAFENTCRHRGVQVAKDHGHCENGFICPFHGWCYAPDGTNTRVTQAKTFNQEILDPAELDLVRVRCDTWGGCAWINLSAEAPPLRECLEPVASVLDEWRIESLRAEWWYACRLPVNWKLAQEAFVEQYHVMESHPQLGLPTRYSPRKATMEPRAYVDGDIEYLRTMSEGMAGMVHATDLRIAERLRDTIQLPSDPSEAIALWHRTLNDEVMRQHHDAGHTMPDLNELSARGMNEPMGYVFPHWFVLPMYSGASSYRFRPLGPEETVMEIWSLTRAADGEERPRLPTPELWSHDDPRWPPIPAQDFSNLPLQQLGLHNRGFEYMRLSELGEGHVSNFERTLDGFLAGLPYEKLRVALAKVNVDPLVQPIADLGL